MKIKFIFMMIYIKYALNITVLFIVNLIVIKY